MWSSFEILEEFLNYLFLKSFNIVYLIKNIMVNLIHLLVNTNVEDKCKV